MLSAFGMILLMTVTISFEESSLNLMIKEPFVPKRVDEEKKNDEIELEEKPLINN
jgi:hypothetical protein